MRELTVRRLLADEGERWIVLDTGAGTFVTLPFSTREMLIEHIDTLPESADVTLVPERMCDRAAELPAWDVTTGSVKRNLAVIAALEAGMKPNEDGYASIRPFAEVLRHALGAARTPPLAELATWSVPEQVDRSDLPNECADALDRVCEEDVPMPKDYECVLAGRLLRYQLRQLELGRRSFLQAIEDFCRDRRNTDTTARA